MSPFNDNIRVISISILMALVQCGCDKAPTIGSNVKTEVFDDESQINIHALLLDAEISGNGWSQILKGKPMTPGSGSLSAFGGPHDEYTYFLNIIRVRNSLPSSVVSFKLKRKKTMGEPDNAHRVEAVLGKGDIKIEVGSDWVTAETVQGTTLRFRSRLLEGP